MKLHVPTPAPIVDANGEETGAVEAFSVHTDTYGGVTSRWLEILGYVVDSDGGNTQRICARIPLDQGLTIVRLPHGDGNGASTERADSDNEGDQGGT